LISAAASLIDTVGVSDSSLPFVDVSVLLDDPVVDDSADSLALSDVEVVSGVEGAVLGAVVVTGAVVASATLPGERVLISRLDEVAEAARSTGIAAPAMVIVGTVVAMRERLRGLIASGGAP
jgi:hypothetical protein